MGKPFDPFADDDQLEFVPESDPTTVAPYPEREDGTRLLRPEHADPDAPLRPAKKPDKPLRLDFSELNDQGGDVRGAVAIGSDSLAADEFLTEMKRRDAEDALHRAKLAQVALPVAAPDAQPRVARKVRTPLYLLAAAAALFVGALVAGGFVFKAYQQHQADKTLEALEHAKP